MENHRIVLLVIVSLFFVGIATAGETDKKFEACRAKLKQAQKLDVLYNLDWEKGREPLVVVGPTFFKIPFDAKEGFAKTVNCFLMVGKDQYINFDLLDYKTNKVVAEYRYGKLRMK